MSVYRLSREVRRVTCVHEAGHAVLHAPGQMAIADHCLTMDAFARMHPMRQPDAPV